MKVNFKKILGTLAAGIIAVGMMGVTAFAADDDDFTIKLNVDDTSKADQVFEGDTGLPGLSYSGGTFSWDGGDSLSELSDKEQAKAVTKFNKNMENAGLSAKASNDLTAMLSRTSDNSTVDMQILMMIGVFDQTKGDLVGGSSIIAPFLPYINVGIGVVAILLVTLLVASTVIDLACIGLPALREWVITKNPDNANGGSGGTKPKAVTYAAWSTINEVEGSGEGNKGSGKNAYFVYFKKRIFDYIILGVCLSVLIFGGFSSIMRAFLEIGKGFAG